MNIIGVVVEETYSFKPDDGPGVFIRSGALATWLNAKAQDMLMEITFPEQPLNELIDAHGLEPERLASMTESEALAPIVVVDWPGGSHVLVDGGHRRYFWAARGKRTLIGWIVPYDIWSLFIFDPNALVHSVYCEDASLLPQRDNGNAT
jgi:hypothetical protein